MARIAARLAFETRTHPGSAPTAEALALFAANLVKPSARTAARAWLEGPGGFSAAEAAVLVPCKPAGRPRTVARAKMLGPLKAAGLTDPEARSLAAVAGHLPHAAKNPAEVAADVARLVADLRVEPGRPRWLHLGLAILALWGAAEGGLEIASRVAAEAYIVVHPEAEADRMLLWGEGPRAYWQIMDRLAKDRALWEMSAAITGKDAVINRDGAGPA